MVSAAWALAALAVLLLWQFLNVHYNRGGNWTALFLIGKDYPAPTELVAGTYRFPGAGYDGEMYRYVAHDPFLNHGYAHYVDGPQVRYRRILLPLLAYLLAAGHQPAIDASYIALADVFVFLGAYWLSRWATLGGLHPAWALAFLLVPATVVSMDRMTIDIALAAFTVAFALYWTDGAQWKIFVVLLLACLSRETGLLLVVGSCLFELRYRRFVRALFWACAALPTLAWYLFLRHVLPDTTYAGLKAWYGSKLSAGAFQQMLQPPHYPLPPVLELVARFGDVLALAGVVLGAILAILIFLRAHPPNPIAISALLFAAFVFALTSSVFWNDVNGYARLVSPLLILVAMPLLGRDGVSGRDAVSMLPWWLGLVPAIAIDLRLGMEFTAAIGGVLRGLL